MKMIPSTRTSRTPSLLRTGCWKLTNRRSATRTTRPYSIYSSRITLSVHSRISLQIRCNIKSPSRISYLKFLIYLPFLKKWEEMLAKYQSTYSYQHQLSYVEKTGRKTAQFLGKIKTDKVCYLRSYKTISVLAEKQNMKDLIRLKLNATQIICSIFLCL